ncbi:MAG: YCF48-related protein [Ignavibacteriae bacterium]|nr:YCF48-related protein [Ignavibacteriota bacterium]
MKKLLILILFFALAYTQSYSQWVNMNLGNGFDILDFSFPNAQTGYISGYGGLLKKTTNGGTNWTNMSFTTTQFNINAVHFLNSNTGLIFSDSDTLYRTTNGTQNWSDKIFIGFHVFDVQFFDSLNGYTSGSNRFAKTTNGGLNWTVNTIQSIGQIFFLNPNTGWTINYVGSGSSSILKTTDAGASWQSQYTAVNFKNHYDIFFTDENTGYASGYRHNIIKTTNGGIDWVTQMEQSSAGGLYSLYFINPNTGWAVGDYYAATNTSTYYTTNGGTNWVNTNGILTGGRLNRVKINNSPVGYVAGQSQSFYKTINAGGLTSINTIESPLKYSLSQNYPNPFNPVTNINFSLPKQEMVSLKIYDVLGREVRTLVNEVKSAGHFSVDFNASEFSSGVYFYRLESEGFSNIKRMLLIK